MDSMPLSITSSRNCRQFGWDLLLPRFTDASARRLRRRRQVPPLPPPRLRQHLRLHQPHGHGRPRRVPAAAAVVASTANVHEGLTELAQGRVTAGIGCAGRVGWGRGGLGRIE